MAAKQINAYAALAKGGDCVPWQYKAPALREHEVEIKISHCGVCHSDIHGIDSGWSAFPSRYPIVPGHEIIGTIVAKGAAVTELSLGDRVGLGPTCYSCFSHDCWACSHGQDQHCPHAVFTYGGQYSDGTPTYGGYAEAVRTHDSLVVKIPAKLPSDAAAPLLCAGGTVWTPLAEHGVKAGMKVGILGMGGLGHLGVQFAAKLGAEVTVISRSASKGADAQRFGAHHFLVSSDPEQMKNAANSLDFILVCATGPGMDWNGYLSLVKPLGKVCIVGAPEEDIKINPLFLIMKKVAIVGSLVAPRDKLKAMLEFSAQHQVLPLIEKLPMAKVNEAITRVRKGNVHYRMVLENPTGPDSLVVA